MRSYWARPENKRKLREKNFNRRGRSITREKYDALLLAQGNACAICGLPERALTRQGKVRELCVDHCHSGGEVRGLLCSTCNTGLGLFKDSSELLHAAVDYLAA